MAYGSYWRMRSMPCLPPIRSKQGARNKAAPYIGTPQPRSHSWHRPSRAGLPGVAKAEASEARLTARPSVQLPVCLDYLSYLFALEFLVGEKGVSDNANAFPDIGLIEKRTGSVIQ